MTDYIVKLRQQQAGDVDWEAVAGNVEDLVDSSYETTMRLGDLVTKEPWADVRAFGAVGDGVVNDSAAIQDAYD